VRLRIRRTIGGELLEVPDDLAGRVADGLVAADQIAIAVGQKDAMAREPARPEQVEKDRAAAEERLEVAAELRWIEAPERGQQLALAACPLQ
jgi:hypothetical protein